MWHKVADGVYCIEDSNGLPMAVATALEDGTPLRIAEQWWDASRRLLDSCRDWLKQFPDLG
jgi:hypothetical protein